MCCSQTETESLRKGSHPEPKLLKKAGWSIERLKDKFITTKKLDWMLL